MDDMRTSLEANVGIHYSLFIVNFRLCFCVFEISGQNVQNEYLYNIDAHVQVPKQLIQL